MSDDLRKFLLLCNRVRSYKLIIAYHVYYDYYKIDRNKQSKIAVHETDILNSHFTEHFYRQSRLTAVEQITFHDTKIKHFTRTNIDHSRLTKIPFPTLYKPWNAIFHVPKLMQMSSNVHMIRPGIRYIIKQYF